MYELLRHILCRHVKLIYRLSIMPSAPTSPTRKYQHVFQTLRERITSGELKEGDRLPSEAELVRQFGASRITVSRAMRDLQQAGLVERQAGSGSYVRLARSPHQGTLLLGLLIPDLGETDIFEAICHGMTLAPLGRTHALIRGGGATPGETKEELALRLCAQYLGQRVDGVFFAPLELTPGKDEVNRRVLSQLDDARIPVVLLDRPTGPFASPRDHDLVGIDNRRAGYTVTEHLLRLGAARVGFVGLPNSASTVDARQAGYRAALQDEGRTVTPGLMRRMDPGDTGAVSGFMREAHPDAVVCANDSTAARLMRTLLDLGYAIPGDVRVVGIDGLDYGSLLPVPLTTLKQPCFEMGVAAMAAMLERIAHPDLPPRDILLHTRLVVRRSCGACPAAVTQPRFEPAGSVTTS
jgi:DNA-binding LacI/PurR family transcriptional regulator